MHVIGVEKGLKNVADYLREQGYSVQMLDESIQNNVSQITSLDAIVAADYNTDMMGYSDTKTRIPVINASGMSAEEVKSMVDNAINKE